MGTPLSPINSPFGRPSARNFPYRWLGAFSLNRQRTLKPGIAFFGRKQLLQPHQSHYTLTKLSHVKVAKPELKSREGLATGFLETQPQALPATNSISLQKVSQRTGAKCQRDRTKPGANLQGLRSQDGHSFSHLGHGTISHKTDFSQMISGKRSGKPKATPVV
ncbi:MAG: hypothetical protein AWU57_2003 [Marinobacter sp. T13-3]|nr:MAG: hypothetical protein AWU57_2003 [Marinobacter sp. T13-3]